MSCKVVFMDTHDLMLKQKDFMLMKTPGTIPSSSLNSGDKWPRGSGAASKRKSAQGCITLIDLQIQHNPSRCCCSQSLENRLEGGQRGREEAGRRSLLRAEGKCGPGGPCWG